MTMYLNPSNVPLALSVFLVTDNYDYESDTVSATKLMRPLRQLVLTDRVPIEQVQIEIASLTKSRMGQALHDAFERSWLNNKDRAMKALGYPEHLIQKVKVNPEEGSLEPGDIPVYLEKRSYRMLDGYKISGKFDFVAEGRVNDLKTTSTYTWIKDTKSEDYKLQGSIYRWLNPDIIKDDFIAINFLFTDWMAGMVGSSPDYPPAPIMQKLFPLMSLRETEAWISAKLRAYETYKDAPETTVPLCNDEELWRKPPVFKYYKNPAKRNRSTKNFDNAAEAYTRLTQDGSVGVVIEAPGSVVACKYCPAFAACTQKDQLIASGDLVL